MFGLWDYVLPRNNDDIDETIPREHQLRCTLHRLTFANSTLNTETCIIDRENSPVDRIIVVDCDGNETIYYVTVFYMMFRAGRLKNTQNGQPDTIVDNITLKDWNNKYVVNISNMFEYSAQTSITFENFNTSNVIAMTQMFKESEVLPFIDIRSFDTRSLLYCESMFNGCISLKTIYMGNFVFTPPPTSLDDGGQIANAFLNVPSGANIYINSTGIEFIKSYWSTLGIAAEPKTLVKNGEDVGVRIQ